MDEKELLTVKEAAAYVKRDIRTIFRWIELGRLKPRRLPSGSPVFRRIDLLKANQPYELGGIQRHDPSMG